MVLLSAYGDAASSYHMRLSAESENISQFVDAVELRRRVALPNVSSITARNVFELSMLSNTK